MRDRIPTQVLENGAVRMEQFDAIGNSLGYVYLKRADEPIENGTPYSVNSVLTDATAQAIGLTKDNPTPNDAFAKLAERLVGLDGAREIIENLENNIIFPHDIYTSSGTFTANKSGRYRITAIGGGGTGGDDRYSTSSSQDYTGGGGGAGGVGVYTKKLNAGDTITFTIANGNASVANIMTAYRGENGEKGGWPTSSTHGAGGAGGAVESQVPGVRIFVGKNGEDGQKHAYARHNERAFGGDISYDIVGSLQIKEVMYFGGSFYPNRNGYGLFKSDLGYGGAGGTGGSDYSIEPLLGGSAGVVIEYLGA